MKVLLIVLSVSLIGCGKIIPDVRERTGDPPKVNTTDPTFDSYKQEFESYRAMNVNVPIIFDSSLGNGTVALCTKWKRGNVITYREITVNPTHWNSYPYKFNATDEEKDELRELKRQQVIDHELGHCQLNLDHNDEILENGHKASIMHSYIFNTFDLEYYRDNLNYYLDELFN